MYICKISGNMSIDKEKKGGQKNENEKTIVTITSCQHGKHINTFSSGKRRP